MPRPAPVTMITLSLTPCSVMGVILARARRSDRGVDVR
jgi:hypothetical protein